MSTRRMHRTEINSENETDQVSGTACLSENHSSAHLFQLVYDRRGARKRRLSEAFLILPSREENPHYYQTISNPMDLRTVARAIRDNSASSKEVVRDLLLVFDNAMLYNDPDSQIHKDASTLKRIITNFIQQPPDFSKDRINSYKQVADFGSEDGNTTEDVEKQENEDLASPSSPSLSLVQQLILLIKNQIERNGDNEAAIKNLKAFETAKFENVAQLRCHFSNFVKSNPTLDSNYSLSLEGQQMFSDYGRLSDHLEENFTRLVRELKDSPLLALIHKLDAGNAQYYQTIENPIDLSLIWRKIKLATYNNLWEMIEDFRLLAKNTKLYYGNSPGTRDLPILCAALDKVNKPLFGFNGSKPMGSVLMIIYENLRSLADPENRKLTSPFLSLPARNKFRHYYEVISNPIDMRTIKERIRKKHYSRIEDGFLDFKHMFDNALFYNDPRSQIYRDTLNLYRAFVDYLAEYYRHVGPVADHQVEAFRILVSIFVETYNLRDENCGQNQSFGEIEFLTDLYDEEFDLFAEAQSLEHKAYMSWDKICKRLFEGFYRRLDCFQDDLLKILEFGVVFSEADSSMHQVSVKLRKFYFECRDRLCGESLLSPALSLRAATDAALLMKDFPSRERLSEAHRGGVDYLVGEFVYIRQQSGHRRILNITSFFQYSGCVWAVGCVFYFPREVYQLCGEKEFREEEVFVGDEQCISLDAVEGHCFVMAANQFAEFVPQGFERVHFCEFSFRKKKIGKVNPFEDWLTIPDQIVLVKRQQVLDLRGINYDAVGFLHWSDNLSIPLRDGDGRKYYRQINGPDSFGLLRSGYSYMILVRDVEKCLMCDRIQLTGSDEFSIEGVIFEPMKAHGQPLQVALTPHRYQCPLSAVKFRVEIVGKDRFSQFRSTEVPHSRVFVCMHALHPEKGIVPLPADYDPQEKFPLNPEFYRENEMLRVHCDVNTPQCEGVVPMMVLTNQCSHQLYGNVIDAKLDGTVTVPVKRKRGRKSKLEDSRDAATPSIKSEDRPDKRRCNTAVKSLGVESNLYAPAVHKICHAVRDCRTVSLSTLVCNYSCNTANNEDLGKNVSKDSLDVYSRFIEVMKGKRKHMSEWDAQLSGRVRQLRHPVDIHNAALWLNEDLRGTDNEEIRQRLILLRDQLVQHLLNTSAMVDRMM